MISLEQNHLGGCILNESVGDHNTWCPALWDMLIETTGAKSVVDIGCGIGYSLKYFLDKGLFGTGIEGLESVLQHSPIPNHILIHDYTKGAYIPEKNVDLAWSCEFVEHVEERFMENFMVTFDKCDYVAMTHALPGQIGYHHVNCQPPEYWIKAFTDRGFDYMENETMMLRQSIADKSYGHWVKSTFMLFKKQKFETFQI